MEIWYTAKSPVGWRKNFSYDMPSSLIHRRLLYGNKHLSIPLAHAVRMKGTYANIQGLLKKIWHENYLWNICADLKLWQSWLGARKSFCVLREWESRARKWLLRAEKILGQKNVARRAVVEKTKMYLPPLYIKVGLIKIFLKAVTKEDEVFNYLRQNFPRKIEAKIKEGIFVGPQQLLSWSPLHK